ncbi:MAG TPA: serine/threonine-protein kinase, partial [Polyangiales bacterium]|nr:serine/threonine-protein kinase [Polyangiales bacterium]
MDALGAPILPMDGELIAGRYRVVSLLGQGGMGVVHAVNDELTGQRLAIKRTLPGTSGKSHELFKREFHTLHGLRHPNIIDVYDYGRDGDRWFYTMELLEGGDLGTAAPLPWRQVCSYLRQIAALLGMLHARRLLHRDVSPRNIWIQPDGRLKLLDFGALSPFGVPTDVVGTPPMIAPEWLAARSSSIHVDQRADLYALGALGYWLLTGTHACHALSIAEVARISQLPQPPSSIVQASIPAELDSLILALLRRDPAARPENVEHVIARIDAIAAPALEPVDHAAHSYLRSKSFVGRRFELQRIELLLRGDSGGAHAVVVQGPAGQGRSRFLEELALLGSLSGAVSVHVRASEPERPYALANALALRLIARMPEQALAAARSGAAVLGQLSREVQQRLGVPPQEVASGRRHELQQALTDWVFALAAQRKLLILVDDVDSTDPETAVWLGALARHANARRLILVVSLRDGASQHSALPLQLLFKMADRLP